jgi:hypothetical protein
VRPRYFMRQVARTMGRYFAIIAIVSLAACDVSPAPEATMIEETAASSFEGQVPFGQDLGWTIHSAIIAATPRPEPEHLGLSVRIREGRLYWEHSYPAIAAAIPALRRDLDQSREKTLSADRDLARSVWNEQVNRLKNPVRNPKPIQLAYRYEVVANVPQWLSLSVRHYDDRSDLAHWTSEYLWDKRAVKQLTTNDLIESKQALRCAIDDQVLAVIRRQKSKVRKAQLALLDDELRREECEIPVEYRIVLGSTKGKAFDRIGVIVQPLRRLTPSSERLEHGAEITLPVTPEIVAAIKPEYRASFSIGS